MPCNQSSSLPPAAMPCLLWWAVPSIHEPNKPGFPPAAVVWCFITVTKVDVFPVELGAQFQLWVWILVCLRDTERLQTSAIQLFFLEHKDGGCGTPARLHSRDTQNTLYPVCLSPLQLFLTELVLTAFRGMYPNLWVCLQFSLLHFIRKISPVFPLSVACRLNITMIHVLNTHAFNLLPG